MKLVSREQKDFGKVLNETGLLVSDDLRIRCQPMDGKWHGTSVISIKDIKPKMTFKRFFGLK